MISELKIGIIGQSPVISKFVKESKFVNGVKIVGICIPDKKCDIDILEEISFITDDYDILLDKVDAVYVISHPTHHYIDIKKAMEKGKHVLCESPIALNIDKAQELYESARLKGLVLVDGIKTAYSTAYSRMILLAKAGKIGEIVSVDSVCTSLRPVDYSNVSGMSRNWNSMCSWGPTALLPVFQLLGETAVDYNFYTRIGSESFCYDEFTKVTLLYPEAVASIKVGKGVKSEGELIVSGTKGYIYVPAPWWMTEYFEIRFENSSENKRYFYQLDGEGIRNEIVSFLRAIENKGVSPINEQISLGIVKIIQDFQEGNKVIKLSK